ncbi:MAG TPA: Mov34/MPN/PAD-1 family protein, partial [Urbifossiella sp.]|nr:Mov34/MPN/PAD-1 family protein [Urbifossiella sp.]
MFHGLSRKARDLAADLTRAPAESPHASPATVEYRPIERIVLTDDVSRTLFEEYSAHRAGQRGDEEMGWVLLGLRQSDQAVALATLPASSDRDAGEAHVWISGIAQVLASRIVRQDDRRLTMLGVVHTHPGSLRHPSHGDLKGDREWIKQLRGGEGVF